MTIRAIIFDLGGVIVRTANFAPRERMADRLGMSTDELQSLIFGGETPNRAQLGEITAAEHWESVRGRFGCSPQQLESLLNEFFSTDFIDQELMATIRRLHATYKTGLLSNAFADLRQLITSQWHIEDAFDDIVISAEVGLMKPDEKIFRLAVDRLGVQASQAVFVDDMMRNVEAARRLGVYGIHFLSTKQVQEELDQLLQTQGLRVAG